MEACLLAGVLYNVQDNQAKVTEYLTEAVDYANPKEPGDLHFYVYYLSPFRKMKQLEGRETLMLSFDGKYRTLVT